MTTDATVFIDGFPFYPLTRSSLAPFLGGAAWSLDRAEGVRRGVRIPSPSPTSPRPYVEPQHGGRGTNRKRRPQ